MIFGQLLDIVTGNVVKKYFAWFRILRSKSRSSLLYQHTIITQKPIKVTLRFFTILKMCTESIKYSKYHLLKINRIILLGSKSKKDLKLVSTKRLKRSRNVYDKCGALREYNQTNKIKQNG